MTARAAVVQGVIPLAGHDIHEIIEGVTTDLFDVAQGTTVTSSSPLFPSFDARSAFGYSNPTGIEPTRTIFGFSATTDFINFQTSEPINLGSYRVFLGNDSANGDYRGATSFRLYASSNSEDVQSHLVSAANFSPIYTDAYSSPAISISEESLGLSGVQYFRLELDRALSYGGPRIIELDGFSSPLMPPVLPQTQNWCTAAELEFDQQITGSSGVNDANGLASGFTHWLPATGGSIPRNDPNLSLLTTPGYLTFRSQRADINQGNVFGRNLGDLDAPAILLTDMIGKDFRVTAKFDDVDVPGLSDQLAIFVGTSADKVVRGGFHENQTFDPSGETGQFYLAGNTGSGDSGFTPPWTHATFSQGDDVVFSFSRVDGVWSIKWDNLSNPAASGIYSGFTVPWLDSESDLYVGLMHLDARNFTSQTAKIDYFRVEVACPVPEPSSFAMIAIVVFGWGVRGGKRR